MSREKSSIKIDWEGSPTILISAMRGSGKSEMIRFMYIRHKTTWNQVFVICPSDFSGFYSSFIDQSNIMKEYDDTWVQKLIEKFSKINEGKNRKSPEWKRAICILDDVIADVRLHSAKGLKQLFARSRHLGITLILSSQHLYSVPPLMRQNSTYVLLGRMSSASQEICAKEYRAGMSKKEFLKLIHDVAGINYQFLLINNSGDNKSLSPDELYGILQTPKNALS